MAVLQPRFINMSFNSLGSGLRTPPRLSNEDERSLWVREKKLLKRRSARVAQSNATYDDLRRQASDKIGRKGGVGSWQEARLTGESCLADIISNVVLSGSYQAGIGLATLVSVALVVLEADAIASNDHLPKFLVGVNTCLVILYTLDIMLRLYVLRCGFFASVPNLIEFLVVLVDIIFEFVTGDTNVFVSLKAARFLRLARLVGTIKQFRELYLILVGLTASLRAVLFGVGLIVITLTLFSVVAVTVVRPIHLELLDRDEYGGECGPYCQKAFDTVMTCNLTLFVTVLQGDNWTMLAILMHNSAAACSIIGGAYVAVNLGLLNTIAAVIVGRQQQAREQDIQYLEMLQSENLLGSLNELEQMFSQYDPDNTRPWTVEDLEAIYDNDPAFRSLLNSMSLHRPSLQLLFDLMDTDASGDLHFHELVSGIHSLKYADTHTLAVLTKHYTEDIYARWADIDRILELVEEDHTMMSVLQTAQGVSSNCEAALRELRERRSEMRASSRAVASGQKQLRPSVLDNRATCRLSSALEPPEIAAWREASNRHMRKEGDPLVGAPPLPPTSTPQLGSSESSEAAHCADKSARCTADDDGLSRHLNWDSPEHASGIAPGDALDGTCAEQARSAQEIEAYDQTAGMALDYYLQRATPATGELAELAAQALRRTEEELAKMDEQSGQSVGSEGEISQGAEADDAHSEEVDRGGAGDDLEEVISERSMLGFQQNDLRWTGAMVKKNDSDALHVSRIVSPLLP
eukprot:TRINITY_DN22348_c0_g1_i4.p1 TRINITY_DN22348_c0_g1~~TRINITY_DN22348_c0_g1_i4.p1  ORF type:complete len:748 (+),score=126.57 TRINITY_DN22348_c0_g1_i4:77-2320(+)